MAWPLKALYLGAYGERGAFSKCRLATGSNANFIDTGIIRCKRSPTAIIPDVESIDREMAIALARNLLDRSASNVATHENP